LRDLNLGPDTKRLIGQYRAARENRDVTLNDISLFATQMAAMLERWLTVGWCWVCACPATVCGGPHVKVRYEFDKTVDIIEPINKVGTTFTETPYHVIP